MNDKKNKSVFYAYLGSFSFIIILLFIAGFQLFILSEQTETYFAWTFGLPLAAAFMGAGYWSAIPGALIGIKTQNWEIIRSSMAPSLIATTMLAITTFLHLDKFHLGSPLFITRFVTWVWIIVYVVTPPALAVAWIIQARAAGTNSRRETPLAGWVRGGLGLLAVIALASGLGLFFVPEKMSLIWPWAITPLAGRAIGSWMCAFGVACTSLLIENDVRNGLGTGSSLFAFCLLQLIVLARYASAMDWTKPMAGIYVVILLFGGILVGTNLFMAWRR
ncbi:MAG TPA: hypothetical protein PLX14_00880 [Anaerolineales bacterium]|nr:hypothetical protein [Anaerolineales bacterium]